MCGCVFYEDGFEATREMVKELRCASAKNKITYVRTQVCFFFLSGDNPEVDIGGVT